MPNPQSGIIYDMYKGLNILRIERSAIPKLKKSNNTGRLGLPKEISTYTARNNFGGNPELLLEVPTPAN